MSRSAYIYIIQERGVPFMAFTVKREMAEYVRGMYSDEGLNGLRAFRVRAYDQLVSEISPFTWEVINETHLGN